MRAAFDTPHDFDPLLAGPSLETIAPWAGVVRGALLGACAWTALLGLWLLY